MNPQHGQTSLDYLNQIAPHTPNKSPFKFGFRTVILGAIAAVILVIILVAIVSAINSSKKGPWEQLSAKLTTTQAVVDSSTVRLKNSQLRSLNSDLKLYLTNTQRDLATPLGLLDINPAKLPESVTTKENSTGITERLEDARLNAKFDSTYAREMSYQLATIQALYLKLYKSTGNTKTKAFLDNSYKNLGPTQKSFAEFSASNE